MKFESDKDVQRLMGTLAEAPQPDADMQARIYAATLAEWEALPDGASVPDVKHRRAGWLAVAASVIALGMIGTTVFDQMPSSKAVGAIASVAGDVFVAVDDEGSNTLAETATVINVAEIVSSGSASQAGIELNSGVYLGMDAQTRLKMISPAQIELLQGRLYVDAHHGQLELITPHTTLTDIGTLYDVSIIDGGTLVTMREGIVEVAVNADKHISRAAAGLGERVVVDASGVNHLDPVATMSAYWQWYEREPLSLDGLSVASYLEYMARTQGVELSFRSPLVEQQTRLLHLSHSGQTTDDLSVDEVMETTDYRIAADGDYRWEVQPRP